MPYVNKVNNFSIQTAEAIAEDQLVSISPMDGLAHLACAGAGIEELPALGVAETTVPAGGWLEVKHFGAVDQAAVWLDSGDLVYTGNVPGAISRLPGDTSQIVGFGTDHYRWVIHIHLLASHSHESSSSSSSSSSSCSSCSSSFSSSSFSSSSSCSSSFSSCSSSFSSSSFSSSSSCSSSFSSSSMSTSSSSSSSSMSSSSSSTQ